MVVPGVAAATVPVTTRVGVAVTGRTVAVTVTETASVTVSVRVGVRVGVLVGAVVLVGMDVGVAGSLNTTWVGEGATVGGSLVAGEVGESAAATSSVGSTAFSGLAHPARKIKSKTNKSRLGNCMIFTCRTWCVVRVAWAVFEHTTGNNFD